MTDRIDPAIPDINQGADIVRKTETGCNPRGLLKNRKSNTTYVTDPNKKPKREKAINSFILPSISESPFVS